jgi:nicotinamide-nucleotide amidase
MKAIILSIGDELVLGQTIDTNSAWLSQQLAALGCDIAQHVTVADDRDATARAIARAAGECDLLIVSGGLGPTADDLTRQALADALGVELEVNPVALAQLEGFFAKRNRRMSATNQVQAMMPRGSEVLENTQGTAPGIAAAMGACRIFVMPGVPGEMKSMFERLVSPKIAAQTGGAVICSRILHTFGFPESIIGEKLGALMDRRRNPSVGTTVSRGLISLRLNARSSSREIALAELDQTESLCREALGAIIFGRDEQTLAGVVGEMLAANSQNLATAESCTGGLLGKMLTDVPGSSRYVDRGWITYSNESKTQMLGVPAELIEKHGAVAEPVALAMADGARQRSGADFALSITGIAGPDGGTADKPVGTVCIALAHGGGIEVRTFVLPGDREMVRERSANMAMTMLRFHLLKIRLPF